MESIHTKLAQLRQTVTALTTQGLCLAFSGGVDSTLLLAVAAQTNGHVEAVTFQTQLHPAADLPEAQRMAQALHVPHHIITVDEFADARIMQNPPERCYFCKKLLFQTLRDFATEQGLSVVADGTNADDLQTYRPGLRAVGELGIASPLAELRITKAEVRAMASALGLEVADRPSAPCLATRLPYGTPIEVETLRRIEVGETYLKSLGFPLVRLRLHGDVVRLEVPKDRLGDLLAQADDLTEMLKELGFAYITLDLAGFRSGSMDEPLDLSATK